ncbi:MAG: glycosyltransferase [Planctomycetes bacterium]|nr:glycosyltransferase [Planctomycetota bacterium]
MQTWRTGRVDFHIHSYASNVTDYYAANTFAIPESYSDPIAACHALRGCGMDLVTLTDHNSIDGVLEMLAKGLPDVFISAEMTTTFPEDGCNIHVTIANVTEEQFREADRLRPNVYEMVAYLDAQIALEEHEPTRNKIAYFMTHPLMSTQNRPYGRDGSLSVEHLEKALLLFQCFEGRNGTRTKSLNDLTMRLIRTLDRPMIERLANKHGIDPKGHKPWSKAIVGGSDDHSGLNQGQTWTVFPYASERASPDDLVTAMRRRDTRPEGAYGGPITLAHAVFKLLHDGQRQTVTPGSKSVRLSGPIELLLQYAFGNGGDSRNLARKTAAKLNWWLATVRDKLRKGPIKNATFEDILAFEARRLLGDSSMRQRIVESERVDDKIFLIISTLLNRVFATYVDRIRTKESVDLIHSVKELVALVTSNVFVSLPYFLSYVSQSSDRFIARDVRKRFELHEGEKVLLATDTLFDVNGVARTIKKVLIEAERRGIDFAVMTCLSPNERDEHLGDPQIRRWVDSGRLKIFDAVVNLDFPEYEGLQVRLPPLLEVLDWGQREGFTKVQLSTPGPVGLAGLAAAKLLQLETSATYHTSFPEYVENYTRDFSLEAFTWKYMLLFYHAVDEVVVPSKFIARLLRDRGLRKRKLLVLDRWVDVDAFNPALRDESLWKQYGIETPERVVKFVYVGRVGVEKNLDVMAHAYRKLRETHPDAHLIVIGDGPYRSDLERLVEGLPATFTGFLSGERLRAAVASCDVKLFPSTTDTWGNAPLEAQAAGLPVVVSDRGGPQELMIHEQTGYRVAGRDVDEMHEAMVKLMDDARRAAMGVSARKFTVDGVVDEPFTAILDADEYRRRAKASEKDDAPTAQSLVDQRPTGSSEDSLYYSLH